MSVDVFTGFEKRLILYPGYDREPFHAESNEIQQLEKEIAELKKQQNDGN